MTPLDGLLAASSPYVAAAFALAGSLIGGFIAGTVSLLVARQTRDAAERAWVRDSRREIYDRYLSSGQKLLAACHAYKQAYLSKRVEIPSGAYDDVEVADREFFAVYGVVQTVAERRVVDAARIYSYRMLELELGLGQDGVCGPKTFDLVGPLVRTARHDTIDAMRTELGLSGSARPQEDFFNPFIGTELEQQYAAHRGPTGSGLSPTAESDAG